MQLFSDQYDIKVVARYLLMAITAIAVWKVTLGFGAAVISLFVIWAVIRERPIEMMFWVLFMTYTSAGNRQLLVANAVSVTTVRATLMLLSIMLVTRLLGGGREARLITPFWGIMVYVAWEAIVSFQGFSPGVSYLKLALFISVFLAMFGVANTVNRSTRTNAKLLRSAILAIITLIVGGSFLLIPFPSLSMMADKAAIEAMLSGEAVSLFQGMTSHSQVMGPMAGILGTFLFADLAFSIKKWDKLYLALLVLCPILIYKTSSRTGMGTFIAGIGIVVFLVMRARGLGANWKGKLMMAVNTLIVLGAIGVCAVPNIRERAAGFALKWKEGADSEDVSFENMVSSRQGLIDESVRNFKAKPFQGNGFQVSADRAQQFCRLFDGAHREGGLDIRDTGRRGLGRDGAILRMADSAIRIACPTPCLYRAKRVFRVSCGKPRGVLDVLDVVYRRRLLDADVRGGMSGCAANEVDEYSGV